MMHTHGPWWGLGGWQGGCAWWITKLGCNGHVWWPKHSLMSCTCAASSSMSCVSVCPHLPTQGWGTLLLAQGGIVLNLLYTAASRSPVLTVLLMLVSGALLMVTGMWLTLQFRFIQMQYPAVVLAFERQVLTASIPVAAIMQVRGAAQERGAEGQTSVRPCSRQPSSSRCQGRRCQGCGWCTSMCSSRGRLRHGTATTSTHTCCLFDFACTSGGRHSSICGPGRRALLPVCSAVWPVPCTGTAAGVVLPPAAEGSPRNRRGRVSDTQ